jgi:hypothetical protein
MNLIHFGTAEEFRIQNSEASRKRRAFPAPALDFIFGDLQIFPKTVLMCETPTEEAGWFRSRFKKRYG